jgi:hypothetical protein
MSKIISLELARREGRSNNDMYGIIFENNQIYDFIFVPSDYTVNEFTDVIINEHYIPANTKIIFDRNGIGIYLDDCFKAKNISNYEINIIHSDRKLMCVMYGKAKELAINLAMNSRFDSIGKIEFKKMLDELDNIEVEVKCGEARLKVIDKDKPVTRALCYLQYLSLVTDVK